MPFFRSHKVKVWLWSIISNMETTSTRVTQGLNFWKIEQKKWKIGTRMEGYQLIKPYRLLNWPKWPRIQLMSSKDKHWATFRHQLLYSRNKKNSIPNLLRISWEDRNWSPHTGSKIITFSKKLQLNSKEGMGITGLLFLMSTEDQTKIQICLLRGQAYRYPESEHQSLRGESRGTVLVENK